MRTPSLYPEIKDDLKVIARAAFNDEDNYVERQWIDIRDQITALAQRIKDYQRQRAAEEAQENADVKS